MRARYTADRDGNLTVVPLPDPNFHDLDDAVTAMTTRRRPRTSDGDTAPKPPADDLRYDSAGHEIGKHLYL